MYAIWFMNQFIVMVILLNFLIAVISQSYEKVMDAKIIHQYKDKCSLNKEAYEYMRYLPTLWDFDSNTILLTLSLEPTENNEWAGFMQTLKKFTKGYLTSSNERNFSSVKKAMRDLNKDFDEKIQSV